MFSISFLLFSIIALYWASEKNKENQKKAREQARKQRLHTQFLQANEWAK